MKQPLIVLYVVLFVIITIVYKRNNTLGLTIFIYAALFIVIAVIYIKNIALGFTVFTIITTWGKVCDVLEKRYDRIKKKHKERE